MNKLFRTKNKIAIILPAFNEELSLDSLLNEIKLHFKKQFYIVVVDDGSDDETFKIASKYTNFVLRHAVNLGKGAALRTGCKFAFSILDVNSVIMMDADQQHAVDDFLKFIKKINKGYGLIFGVRSFKGMPRFAAFANKVTSLILKIIYGIYIPDILSGYKAISRKVYERLNWQAVGYEVEIDIAKIVAREKIPFITLPIKTIYLDQIKGVSFVDAVRVWFNLLGFK